MSSDLPSRAALPLADELSQVFARLSGVLLSSDTVVTVLGLLGAVALETVPGAAGAAVTIVDPRGRRTTSGATDARVELADKFQYELEEGPCLAAAASRQVMRADDLTQERRWPRWAAALELRAALSAPMVAGNTCVGALKVYADRPGAFDGRSEHLVTMFAGQAAVLVRSLLAYQRAERLSDELRRAMRDRDLVHVAAGVLVARERVEPEAALGRLIATARAGGTTVREAARATVDAAAGRRR